MSASHISNEQNFSPLPFSIVLFLPEVSGLKLKLNALGFLAFFWQMPN
jgi:hypothetical protein